MSSTVKLTEMRTADEIHERSMRNNPEYRREIERTQLANDVAIKVIRYRADHGLSQAQLARKLGMRQPHIARLEAGDHEPSVTMLGRLADALGLDFSLDIKRGRTRLRYPARRSGEAPPERQRA
jgi:ribosome-binding protein aMBF1 (putative translation factor)